MKPFKSFILSADLENGEGKVFCANGWKKLDGLTRADCLKDWLFELEIEYNKAVTDWMEELKDAFPNVRPIEKPELRIVGGREHETSISD